MAIKSVEKMIKEKRERACYGSTNEDFVESAFIIRPPTPASYLMVSASIMSDCQELIERLPGDQTTGRETLRQWLNRAKWCIVESERLRGEK